MKILLCHNHYQQAGGEDQVFVDEARLLEAHGHSVLRYTRHNDEIREMGRWDVARRTLWNRQSYQELRRLIRRHRPQIMHCTNTFPLISPAAYYAARAEGVPVVQSLHNFRLLCANVLFLRDGRPCEDCLGRRIPWPGILHGCYRDDRAASAVVAAMQLTHRAKKTWTRAVDRYIALSQFARDKFVKGGLPAEKISVKSNFVYPDPAPGSGRGGYAVAVGRLSSEKGIETLLAAWADLPDPLPLKIIGEGPLVPEVMASARLDPRIAWLGRRPVDEVLKIVGNAACLVLPSICYENCPKVLLEAYAKGTPVIGSRIGAIQELIDEGRTGLLFSPGDSAALAACLRSLLADPRRRKSMRQAARQEYLQKYTAQSNYQKLLAIYQEVAGHDPAKRSPSRSSVSPIAIQTDSNPTMSSSEKAP